MYRLVRRLDGQHRYTLSADGRRSSVFYTNLANRVVAPLVAGDQPNGAPPILRALAAVDRATGEWLRRAR